MKRLDITLLCVLMLAVFARPVFAEPIPDPLPPCDNAAVWYLTAQLVMGSYDDDAKAVVESWDELDADAGAEVVDNRLADAMAYIRRGASLDRCSWAVDFEQDGFGALLPHLTMLREYAKILAVSGQVRMNQSDAEGAIEDFVAIIRLSRHGSSDGSLIGCLVQFSIEKIAADTLAKQLHRFDRDQLDLLRQQLAALPPNRATVRSAIPVERLCGKWIKTLVTSGDFETLNNLGIQGIGKTNTPKQRDAIVEKLIKLVDELDTYYQRLYDNLGLSYEEFVKADAKFVEDVQETNNILVAMLMPALRPAYDTQRNRTSTLAILDAAIALRLDGEQAFGKVFDPADGKPFDRQMTDEGMVISSRLKKNDEAVSLRFSSKLAEALK